MSAKCIACMRSLCEDCSQSMCVCFNAQPQDHDRQAAAKKYREQKNEPDPHDCNMHLPCVPRDRGGPDDQGHPQCSCMPELCPCPCRTCTPNLEVALKKLDDLRFRLTEPGRPKSAPKPLDLTFEMPVASAPVDDPVQHPAHYTRGSIEVWDFIIDQGLNYCRGTAVKYLCRAGVKDPAKEIEDLKKAIAYINRDIRRLEDK